VISLDELGEDKAAAPESLDSDADEDEASEHSWATDDEDDSAGEEGEEEGAGEGPW
jgi:hypothetical protein